MTLRELMQKKEKTVIGLMSGTSADGIDAALLHIRGSGTDTDVSLISYLSVPFPEPVRQRILTIAEGGFGGSREICLLGGLLGELYLNACEQLCRQAGIPRNAIDLVGCHGQTVFHQPDAVDYLGFPTSSTLQIGDVSPICEGLGAIAVSDFRVRDMAAGGCGAPLVPYTEYLLYRKPDRNIALQNIGGMGNITFLPAGCRMEDVTAFDTGPGNVLIDAAAERLSGGELHYDRGGKIAAAHSVSSPLLHWLMKDPYLKRRPPKTTGREYYSRSYFDRVCQEAAALGVSDGDLLSTLTAYTAHTIALSVREYLPALPHRLIVGGGGSFNRTLLLHLKQLLPEIEVLTNEDLGLNSDAKEAVAFGILANEAICGVCGNVPSATGARHPVILGKISQ